MAARAGSWKREREELSNQLRSERFTEQRVATLTEFAQSVAQGLEQADQDFEARRRVIDLLDVRATLAVEDHTQVVYVRSLIDDHALPIGETTSNGAVLADALSGACYRRCSSAWSLRIMSGEAQGSLVPEPGPHRGGGQHGSWLVPLALPPTGC